MTTQPKVLYRYTSYVSEDTFEGEMCIELVCAKYKIVAYTLRGYWIGKLYPSTIEPLKWKWISAHTVKRFAYPTKYQALKAFVYRKRRQIPILNWQLAHAKLAQTTALKELETYDQN